MQARSIWSRLPTTIISALDVKQRFLTALSFDTLCMHRTRIGVQKYLPRQQKGQSTACLKSEYFSLTWIYTSNWYTPSLTISLSGLKDTCRYTLEVFGVVSGIPVLKQSRLGLTHDESFIGAVDFFSMAPCMLQFFFSMAPCMLFGV